VPALSDEQREPAVLQAESRVATSVASSAVAANDGGQRPNGDEVDERMAQIEKILDHAAMSHLEKCELVAEWVHYAEAAVSGHLVQKPQGGRPEGGIARASRALAVPGKTIEARRKFVERAVRIAGIWP